MPKSRRSDEASVVCLRGITRDMNGTEHTEEKRRSGLAISRSEGPSSVAPRRVGFLRRLISSIGHLTAKIGLSDRRKDERVSARELIVSYSSASGEERRQSKLKDLSPTGAYLLTGQRWFVGTRLLLTLQSRNRKYRSTPHQVQLAAKVVRLGKDGVGVSFIDENFGAEQWLNCVSKVTSLASGGGAVRLFQMAKALVFLLRISHAAEEGFLRLLGEEFAEERIDNALEIVLRADDLLASRTFTQSSAVAPELFLHVLEKGSNSNEEPLQECWAALLVAFSLDGSNDQENLRFAALLSKLELVHVLIVAAAGQKAAQTETGSALATSVGLHCKIDEIKRVTRTRNLAVIECALNRLYEFGLLELTAKPFGCTSLESANLALTQLGLAFYRACWGKKEAAPEEFVSGTREEAC